MSYIENARRLRPIVEQAMQSVDGNDALTARMLYPTWETGKAYAVGTKVQKDGKLWCVLQYHASQLGWEPENTPTLWVEINETNTGTIDNPIPYDGNMELEQGKHYVQDGVIYLCTRDTVNPVYHPLASLVGLYVEVTANG
jgi:hypothetical protein